MTPTATTVVGAAAIANASVRGCPAAVRPSRAENEIQVGRPTSYSRSARTSASSTSGIVSTASRSGPAEASSRGEVHGSPQPGGGDAVPPAVLGTVREHRSVGADRRRDPALDAVAGHLVAHFTSQRDAVEDERRRLDGQQSLVDEARDAGLVARRRRDARPARK